MCVCVTNDAMNETEMVNYCLVWLGWGSKQLVNSRFWSLLQSRRDFSFVCNFSQYFCGALTMRRHLQIKAVLKSYIDIKIVSRVLAIISFWFPILRTAIVWCTTLPFLFNFKLDIIHFFANAHHSSHRNAIETEDEVNVNWSEFHKVKLKKRAFINIFSFESPSKVNKYQFFFDFNTTHLDG